MAIAEGNPSFARDGAPVSVLVDFDGTISPVDVTDHLMERFAADPAFRQRDADYLAGRVGSRELLAWDMTVLAADRRTLERTAAEQPLDPGFRSIVDVVGRHGAAVEVVSDGFGFYVQPALDRLGVGEVPISTAVATFPISDSARLAFPFGHPQCFVCGTCKRERVRAHQACGRAVVFVGDGESDRFAAAHAEVVFARPALAVICRREGWPFQTWDDLGEVAARIEAAFASGDLPTRDVPFESWRARHGRAPGAFICGPEAWGPGRTAPRRAGAVGVGSVRNSEPEATT